MELEAIRGVLAKRKPPYRFKMADGDVIVVEDESSLVLPPTNSVSQTMVLYFPGKKGLLAIDAFMVTSLEATGSSRESTGQQAA
jgi:hypothetical protein